MRLVIMAAVAVATAMPALAQLQAPGPTLAAIRAKGGVDCGAHPGAPGFGLMDSRGIYRGLDADTCRAVAAAIFEGDGDKVRWSVLNSQARIPALQSGQVDMLARTFTWSHARDTASGITLYCCEFL